MNVRHQAQAKGIPALGVYLMASVMNFFLISVEAMGVGNEGMAKSSVSWIAPTSGQVSIH